MPEEYFYDIGRFPVDTGQSVVSGLPDMYQSMINANPYRNLTYNKTGWQKFLSNLGFRTSYDDFVEQAQINANEYDAGILSMYQQNQFNSPAQQAERMRTAGMNPDLLGTGDVAGSASPTEDPNGMPAQNSGEDFGRAMSALTSFAGGFQNVIAGALSLYKNFQDIASQRIEQDGLVSGLAEDDVFKSIPATGFATDEEFQTWHLAQHDMVTNPDFFKLRKIPRYLQNRYRETYTRALNSLPTDIARYKSAVERAKLRKELSLLEGSSYYDRNSDEALSLVVEPLVKLADRVTLLEAQLAEKSSENKITEQNIVSGELENRAIEADLRGEELGIMQDLNYGVMSGSAKYTELMVSKLIAETQNEIISGLRKASQDGDRLARCLEYQMVLSKFYNWNPAEAIQNGVQDLTNILDIFVPSKKLAKVLSKSESTIIKK